MNHFLREQRLYNNGLQKKFTTADTCVQALMGIQSQLHYYGLISIYNRTNNTSIQTIAKSKKLIKSWGQRSTHHIYHKDDYAMINVIMNSNPQWPMRHLNENNIDTKELVETLRDFCLTHDEFTKEELLEAFPESSHPFLNVWSTIMIISCTHGFMHVKVLEDNTKRYCSSISIKNNPKDMKHMLNQYFTYYGPATIQDFSHWSGLPQRDFIEDFNLIKETLYCTENKYFSIKKPRKVTLNYPIILGKFDPLLVSYKDKSWILGEHDSSMIWRKAAHVEGVIIDETGLIATWHYNAKPNEMTYIIKPLNNLRQDYIQEKFNSLTHFMKRESSTFIFEEAYYI